jgi:phosphomannomutase
MPQRILSISGLRGVIGDGLDPAYLIDFACAFGTLMDGGRVVVCRDGRSSGLMVKHAVIAGLTAAGCTVVDCDIASTPTCGVLVTELRAAGGLQITASHNPVEWNGLKPFSPAGSVFDQSLGERLLAILNARAFRLVGWDKLGHVESLATTSGPSSSILYSPSSSIHLAKVHALVDVAAIRSRRVKVVLDCNHGSGGVLGPKLLESLGCDVVVMGGTPDGRFEHVPEPLEQNLGGLCAKVREVRADVGFAQDPDADRLAIVDETGRYIGEELTLALCADLILARTPGPVVVNGSTSRTTADIAAKHGCPFFRSHVGEANVVATMREVNAIIGGEGNGGLIEPKVGYVRDSFAAMAYVLAGLASHSGSQDRPSYQTAKTVPGGSPSKPPSAARGEPLSKWVDSLPKYTIVKDKLTCDRDRVTAACAALKRAFADAAATEGDGLRLDWPDRWVQVRASNTEPILRVIAEAPDPASARDLCSRAMDIVRSSG